MEAARMRTWQAMTTGNGQGVPRPGGWRLLRQPVLLAACAGLLLVTAGPSTRAENSWDVMRDPTVNRGRSLGWFGTPQPVQRPAPKPRPRPAAAETRRSADSAAVVVHDAPILPKSDPSHFIVVMGDTLAELLANGLDDTFADRPDVALVRKARSDSGLVRSDFYDWGRSARELLASDQKISVGVILLGANDRQSIKEGDVTHEPLSERWRDLYRDRIDAVASAFAERKVPLIWVGAPPMQSARLTTDLIAFNDMFRQRVERSGGTYVDLWEGFVDAQNRYTASGPDLTGQIARLRAADGVHFTKAGARKAAHFVDVAIRRLLLTDRPHNIIALPPLASLPPASAPEQAAAAPAVSVDDLINRMAGFGPGQSSAQLPQAAVVPVKPVAGPILQLSGATGGASARDTRLLADAATARGSGYQAVEIDRVFADGVAPAPRQGQLATALNGATGDHDRLLSPPEFCIRDRGRAGLQPAL
jgi:uncharacterized protein